MRRFSQIVNHQNLPHTSKTKQFIMFFSRYMYNITAPISKNIVAEEWVVIQSFVERLSNAFTTSIHLMSI